MPAITQNLFFIDGHLEDYETLIAKLPIDSEWFLLNLEEDGIAQMVAVLSDYANLDSIQILSHGGPGMLYLGTTVLSSKNLAQYKSALGTIGGSLSETGNIMLYGHSVAQGEAGISFINTLAQFTGADVAASEGFTGAVELGGDGVLEQTAGGVEATPLVLEGIIETLTINTAPSFTVPSGKITTAISASNDVGAGVLVQFDGKIVLVGTSYDGSGSDIALVRYNIDGSLDTSFDGDGKVVTKLGSSYDSAASGTLQADGKILVAGHSITEPSYSYYNFALLRYNNDGSLDTSFGDDGKVITTIGGFYDFASDVVVQADGKILVAGGSYSGNDNDIYDFDIALARYNSDGSLDTSFDGDGKLTTAIGASYDVGVSITLLSDGKILVAGVSGKANDNSGNDFVLVRYNTDGSLDTSFDGDGKVVTAVGSSTDVASDLAVQADGKILVAGVSYSSENDSDFALVRYNTDGSLDASFGNDGQVITDFGGVDSIAGLALQADGKILATGGSINGSSVVFAMARYNTDGSLDTTLDSDGKITTAIGSSTDAANDAAVQADGKILAAGLSYSGHDNSDFAVVRYNLDGSLDTDLKFDSLASADAHYIESTRNYTGLPAVLATWARIYDAELTALDNYAGATLTLARHGGANAEDRFSGANIMASISSGDVQIDYTLIGRYTQTSGELVITFNSNATQARVDHVMQRIAYANTSDTPPASVEIDWTFNDGNAGTQGHGGALSTVGSTTVTITAINDAPVPRAEVQLGFIDTSAADQFDSASGSLAGTDPEGDVLTYTLHDGVDQGTTMSLQKAYGTLTLNKATGAYSFVPDAAAIEGLRYAATETYAFTLSDGQASEQSVLRINIDACEDSTVFGGVTAATVTKFEVRPLTGTLAVIDGDTGDAVVQAHDGTTGQYGQFRIDAAGTWRYALNTEHSTVKELASGSLLEERFTVQVGSGATQAIMIGILGAIDPPVLQTPAAISFTDSVADDLFDSVTGTLQASDASSEIIVFGLTDGTDSGTNVYLDGTYGRLEVTKTSGTYRFIPNDAAIESLKVATSETFVVTASNGESASVAELRVEIVGADDVSAFSENIAASLRADSTQTTSGTLAVSDRDTGDAAVVAQAEVAGLYGTFNINTQGQWSYALDNATTSVRQLGQGQTGVDRFNIVNEGGAEQEISITVQGLNDEPQVDATLPDASIVFGKITQLPDLTSIFSDPDQNSTLSYAITLANGSAAPDWLVVNPVTGALVAMPGNEVSGSYTFKAIATDAQGLQASDEFTVSVSGESPTSYSERLVFLPSLTSANKVRLDINLNPGASSFSINLGFQYDAGSVTYDGTTFLGSSSTSSSQSVVGSLGQVSLSSSVATSNASSPGYLLFTPKGSSGTFTVDFTTVRLNSTTVSYREPDSLGFKMGTSGTDMLYGGTSTEWLLGGGGDDTYVIQSNASVIQDSGGVDTLQSYIDTALNTGIEHLTLLEGGALYGMGNAADNVLLGNANANVLSGLDGNDDLSGQAGGDLLLGGAGDDTLDGGIGNDIYLFRLGSDFDTIYDFDSTSGNYDIVRFIDIQSTELTALRRQGNDLVLDYSTTDGITVKNYFTSPDHRIEQFRFSNGVNWFEADIDLQIATNAAPIVTSNGGETNAVIIINENSTAVTTISASDVDNANLIFSLVGGADLSRFSINAISGELSFIAAPDFEQPTDSDGNNLYEVTVQVSDGVSFDTQSIAVTVTNLAEALTGNTVDLLAYSWKNHTLLDGVVINSGERSGRTDKSGAVDFSGIIENSISLTASRAIPAEEVSATQSAVNLQDAIAILKMIVGLDVNRAGKPLSPYQSLAADFDGNGTIGLNDAIGVLKHVMGLPAPEPNWQFAYEADMSLPMMDILKHNAQLTIHVPLNGASPIHIGLVGYLRGDVDGSFASASGAIDLDDVQPDYFRTLTTDTGLSLSQFGVYAT